jgi:3-methyladenine DNA glycosylase/8-oxoguanine DNA glycosylase
VRRLAGDPVVGPLLRARPGLRPPGTWDAFETGVRAIIGQQATLAGGNTIAGRLVERLGTPVRGLGRLGLSHTFPSPATLAGADLSGLGLTTSRADAIRGFSRAVVRDEVRLDRSVGLDRLVAALTALDGVGSWTAQYLALRLGEPDAYPATDLALRRAVRQRASKGGAAVRAVDKGWRPWRALAAAHIWLAGDRQEASRTTRGAA